MDAPALPWEHGVPADLIRERLAADTAHTYKAVMVVHNETSTAVVSNIQAIRQALDATGHPALLVLPLQHRQSSLCPTEPKGLHPPLEPRLRYCDSDEHWPARS